MKNIHFNFSFEKYFRLRSRGVRGIDLEGIGAQAEGIFGSRSAELVTQQSNRAEVEQLERLIVRISIFLNFCLTVNRLISSKPSQIIQK